MRDAVAHLLLCSLAAYLDHGRPKSTGTPTPGCHLASNAASPSVHATGTAVEKARFRHGRLVIEAKAEREGAGRSDGGAGEDAGKVDHVEAVVEIANIALEAHGSRFFFVEIEGSGEIDR